MAKIQAAYRLKKGIENPNMYLGTDMKKWKYTEEDGTQNWCWALGSCSYVKEAVRVSEGLMKEHSLKPSSTRKNGKNTPFSNHGYRPELDASEFCNDTLCTVYQNLIGILCWTCELGRIDVLHETAILSQYLAQPRI